MARLKPQRMPLSRQREKIRSQRRSARVTWLHHRLIVKLPLWLRRWRALRVPELTASTPEGAIVKATGVVRDVDRSLTAPMSSQPCVVVLTTYTIEAQAVGLGRPPATVVERLQVRRFELDTGVLRVIVEPSVVELLLESETQGHLAEAAVRDGDRITVVGSVLRGGGERPTADSAFREDRPSCMLVGGPSHPIVIASSDSRTRR